MAFQPVIVSMDGPRESHVPVREAKTADPPSRLTHGRRPARWTYKSLSRGAPAAVVAFRSTSRWAARPPGRVYVRLVFARPHRAASGPQGQPFPQPGSKALEVGRSHTIRQAQRADRSTNRTGDAENAWPVGPKTVLMPGRFPAPWAGAGRRRGPLGLSIDVAGCSTARCCGPVHIPLGRPHGRVCVRFAVARPERAGVRPKGPAIPPARVEGPGGGGRSQTISSGTTGRPFHSIPDIAFVNFDLMSAAQFAEFVLKRSRSMVFGLVLHVFDDHFQVRLTD
jgi:hypothetical protein